MSTESQTYYACYRGYVYLYQPFQAANADEATDFQSNLPCHPDPNAELIMSYNGFDFEPDECYEPQDDLDIINPPSKALANQVIKSAHNQGKEAAARFKMNKINQLQTKIDNANKQLLIATKGITEQIASLTDQLKLVESS